MASVVVSVELGFLRLLPGASVIPFFLSPHWGSGDTDEHQGKQLFNVGSRDQSQVFTAIPFSGWAVLPALSYAFCSPPLLAHQQLGHPGFPSPLLLPIDA